jgi:hypothetical protein
MRQFILVSTHHGCPYKFYVGSSGSGLHLRLREVDLVRSMRVAIITWWEVQFPLRAAKDLFAF